MKLTSKYRKAAASVGGWPALLQESNAANAAGVHCLKQGVPMLRTGTLILTAAAALIAAPANDATFHKDIEPILQARCQGCHRPGEAAPMSLLTYQEARPWAKAIREAVLTRKMPPWFADPAHGNFSNDRRMPQAEIDRMVAWADSGAKEGNPKDAPKPRTFTEGWVMGKPDAVVEMPVDFPVPASGTVEYTYFVVPTGFTEDKWVENVEVRAGNRKVVHHIVVEVRPPGVEFLTDAKSGEPFVPSARPSRTNPTRARERWKSDTIEVAGVYVPGGVPYYLKPGQARLIPAGSDLVFQMHYTTNGKAATDRSRVGFQFAKQPPDERVVNTLVDQSQPAHSGGRRRSCGDGQSDSPDGFHSARHVSSHARARKGIRVSRNLPERKIRNAAQRPEIRFQLAAYL